MALTRSIGAYDDGTPSVPGVGTTPLDTRKSLSALWASAGVVAGGPSPLVTGTAGFAYSVAGPVPFVTTRGPSDGFHMFTNDGAVTVPITNAAGVTLTGAPGSGLQRIDILWVQHRSNSENSDTTSAPRFGVESGAAVSSSPVAPSLPAGALELARNTMTSAATSTASTGNSIAQTAAVAVPRAPAFAWSFTRPGTTSTYGSVDGFASLLPLTITNAPAGQYTIDVTLTLAGSVSAIGNIRAMAGATNLSGDVRADTTVSALPSHWTWLYTHTGGNLVIAVNHQITAGIVTVFNPGCTLVVKYAGM